MMKRWLDHLNAAMGGPVSSWLPGIVLVVAVTVALVGTVGAMTYRTASSSCAGPNPLASYRWANRPLVAIAPPGDERPGRHTTAMLRDVDALSDRDMVLLSAVGMRLTVPFGEPPRPRPMDNLMPDTRRILSFEDMTRRLRLCFGVAPDTFAVILVGLDGREKARWSGPPAPDEVFALIDAMPMRLRELRERADEGDE